MCAKKVCIVVLPVLLGLAFISAALAEGPGEPGDSPAQAQARPVAQAPAQEHAAAALPDEFAGSQSRAVVLPAEPGSQAAERLILVRLPQTPPPVGLGEEELSGWLAAEWRAQSARVAEALVELEQRGLVADVAYLSEAKAFRASLTPKALHRLSLLDEVGWIGPHTSEEVGRVMAEQNLAEQSALARLAAQDERADVAAVTDRLPRSPEQGPELYLYKSLSSGAPAPGKVVTYALYASNYGDAAAHAVVVTDALPSATQLVSAWIGSGVGWTVVSSGSRVTWTTAIMSDTWPGSSATLYVSARVTTTAAVGSQIVNQACASAEETRANSELVCDTDTQTVIPEATDVIVRKAVAWDSDENATPGGRIKFLLYFRNQGATAAANVIMTDTLPPGTSFVSAGGSPVVAGNQVVWNIGTLNYSAYETSRDLTLLVSNALAYGAILTNQVTITASSDVDPSNNRAAYPFVVVPAARDVSVSKYLDTGVPMAGQLVTYSIYVNNTGNVSATQVVVTDALPAATTYVTATVPSGWSLVQAGGIVTWTAPALEANDSESFYLVVSVTGGVAAGTILTDTISIRTAGQETDCADNTDIEAVTAVGPTPDLLVAKYPQTYRAGSGQLYDYYIIYRNAGGGLAQSVILTDDLPAGVSYVSFEPSGGQPAPVVTGTRVVWQLPAPVAYKRSTTSLGNLRVRVNPGVQTGALLTNVVRISTSSSEPVRDNNIYTNTLEVVNAADLYVYKYLTSGTPAPGRLVTFTVSAGNDGTVTATQVVVTDLLPVHTTFVTATAPAGWVVTRAGSMVTWTAASLAGGQTANLVVVARVDPAALVGAQITNTVAITGAAGEIYTYDNHDEYGFTIASLSADLWVRKALPLTIGPNARLETVIYYSNGGLETAWSVFFTDTLPVGVSGVRWNDCPVTPNANRELWWLLGRLNYQGYTSSLGKLSFVAPPTVGVVLTNVVRAGSVTPEYTATNNTSVATTTVQLPAPPRSVAVTGPREGVVGRAYDFTATVGPVTTTLPLTYTWRATERYTNTHADQSSLQDVTYMYWFTPGVKLITVTVTNITGTVTGTHAITISQPAYSLTVHIVGQGVVTRTPDQATYLAGTPVQLVAGAGAAWRFAGWSGDLTGTANPDTIVMNSNKEVTATFLSSGTSAQVVPGIGGGVTYTDAQGQPTAVRIGPGGVTETIFLSFVPRDLAHLVPPLPAGWGYGRHAFALVVYRGGQAASPYWFAGPVTVTVGYSDQDIARLREDTLQLRYLDAGGQWQDAAATCNPPNAYIRDLAANRLTARVCRTAEFALAGAAKSLAFVPITLR